MHSVSCTNTHHDVTDLVKSWDGYKNNISRMEHNFSLKQKNYWSVPQMTHFEKLLFCNGGDIEMKKVPSKFSEISVMNAWFAS